MKFVVAFAVVVCLVICFASQSMALPAASPQEAQFIDGLEVPTKVEHGRYKRATCDLLSAAGVSHTACAAHCLLLGHRGGYCNGKAICVCRD